MKIVERSADIEERRCTAKNNLFESEFLSKHESVTLYTFCG